MKDKGKNNSRCILPKECPEGGDHKWVSCCEKCDMKIFYNPEATIGSKAPRTSSKE